MRKLIKKLFRRNKAVTVENYLAEIERAGAFADDLLKKL
jgi:hypothetical protein